MGNLGEFFSHENTPERHTETHKSSYFPYKQVSGRNGDHEWLRMINTFILYDLLWKVQKSHAANREGSFNLDQLSTTILIIYAIHVDTLHPLGNIS